MCVARWHSMVEVADGGGRPRHGSIRVPELSRCDPDVRAIQVGLRGIVEIELNTGEDVSMICAR